MRIWEFIGTKPSTDLQRCQKKWYGQIRDILHQNLQGLGPVVLLEGRVTWKWSLPSWQCSHPEGTMGHWMVWCVWKWCNLYAMAFAVARSQPYWTSVGDFGVTWQTTTIIKTSNEGTYSILVCKDGVELWRVVQPMPRLTKAVLVACGSSTPKT